MARTTEFKSTTAPTTALPQILTCDCAACGRPVIGEVAKAKLSYTSMARGGLRAEICRDCLDAAQLGYGDTPALVGTANPVYPWLNMVELYAQGTPWCHPNLGGNLLASRMSWSFDQVTDETCYSLYTRNLRGQCCLDTAEWCGGITVASIGLRPAAWDACKWDAFLGDAQAILAPMGRVSVDSDMVFLTQLWTGKDAFERMAMRSKDAIKAWETWAWGRDNLPKAMARAAAIARK